MNKRTPLGKGLGALIPDVEAIDSRTLLSCGIEEIFPNPSQPRRHFDESKLQELADSIKEKGVLEPLLVRKSSQGYELIVGERRWRAAQKAGLKEVPVLVKDAEPGEAYEISLIENIQREDLNPIEEAEAFRRLIEDFGISQSDMASRLGKDRTTIANALRLLKLPPEIRGHLLENRITAGHARAILSLESMERQKQLANLIIEGGLSVRQAEQMAKRLAAERSKRRLAERTGDLQHQLNSLQDSLRRHLGTKVLIRQRGKKGRIQIEYYSSEELDRIAEAILGSTNGPVD
jgi:ParB family transcriptional regulator, chromosome partitioning protein